MNKRGSVWNKWDLQIQPIKAEWFCDVQNKKEEIKNATREYLKKAIERQISVVAITDHNCGVAIDIALNLVAAENLNITVLPGVEVDVNTGYQILVVLNPSYRDKIGKQTWEESVNHFLNHICTLSSPVINSDGQAESINGDVHEILDKICKEDIGIPVFAHSQSDKGLFKKTTAANRKKFFEISYSGKYYFILDHKTDADILETKTILEGWNFKPNDFAFIKTSDAHQASEVGSVFTWIKADTTFDGLKQILWEPNDRIRVQDRNPNDTKSSRIVIDRLSYKDKDGNEQLVLLNKDLNSIIGIRGSGKSTLLKNIAHKVDPIQFSDRDKVGLYNLESFKVIWGDGKEDNGIDESPKSVFYIPQNYLSLLAYDETGKAEARDEFLTKLLKKNVKFANAIRAYDDFVSDNKVKIEGLIEKLLKENGILSEAKVQFRKQGSRKEIEDEIKTKNEDIKKYKGTDGQTLTEEEIKSYTQAKQAVTDSNKSISILEQDKSILSGLLESGADVYIANQEITRLSSQRQLALRTELLKKSKESLSELIKNEVSKIDIEIKVLNKTITDNQQVLDKFGDRIKANKALETLTKELGQLQQTLKTIDELGKTISQATSGKGEALTGLVDAYWAFDTQQDTIFGTVEFNEDFKFLKIDIGTYYNTTDLKEFVIRNINTRDTDPSLKIDPDIATLFGEAPAKLSLDVVRKIIENLVNEKMVIKKEAVDIPQVISQLLKNRHEIDFLNSVKTKEDEILFKNMTGGQKAIAMLELVFSFDDEHYPILIDQPEDDLDVSGVATDLVNFIKVHKENRQIIVVSHNGSLVVCADTEEVVVSECVKLADNKYDFSYDTGAIENPETRNHIIKVLEGGKEALKQRARKLNFKHEI